MKIKSKLLIANVLITLVGMIVLGMMTLFIITNYIKENVGNELIERNRLATRSVLQQERLEELDGPKPNIRRISYMNVMIDLAHGTTMDNFIGQLREADKETFLRMTINQVQSVEVAGGKVLAYASERKNNQGHYLVITYAYNDDIQIVANQIINILLTTTLLVGMGIVYVNMLFAKYITKPIGQLVEVTEKIGNHLFDEKVTIETQDEFNHLAKAINKMGAQLKAHDVEQRKLYENFSHELKTPLTVISGYAEGIKSGVFNEDKEPLDEIVKSCQVLRKQIDQMIYLSKLDSINEKVQLVEIDLNRIIVGILDALDSLIIVRELDILFEPEGSMIIRGDEEKIKRMISNCLTNCIKYTNDTISIQLKEDKDWVTLQIDDNGIGFSDEILEKPFTRNIVGTKEGTGLGLSIAKKVIDQHKGSIEFSNKATGGACYKIKLPQTCHK